MFTLAGYLLVAECSLLNRAAGMPGETVGQMSGMSAQQTMPHNMGMMDHSQSHEGSSEMLCCVDLQWVVKTVAELSSNLIFFVVLYWALVRLFWLSVPSKVVVSSFYSPSPPSLVRLKVLLLC